MKDKNRIFLEEEKPLLELPQLIFLGIVFGSILIGLMVLFLPLTLVIAFFVGLLFTIAIFFKPVIGLFVLFFCIYVTPFEFIPALRSFHITRLLSIVTLFTWLARIMIFRENVAKSPHNLFAFAFIGLAALSLFQDFDHFFMWLLELIKVIILYFLVANLINKKRHLVEFIGMLIIVSVILAGMGVFEYYTGRQILSYAAERAVESKDDIYRVSGTRGEHGEFSTYLVISVPLILGFFFHVRSKLLKLLLLVPFALVSLAIVLSFSRAGMLALAAVLFLSVLRKRKAFFLLIALAILILLVVVLLIPPEYWQHTKSITNLQDPAIRARLNIYQAAWRALLAHPIFGIGYRTFYYHSFDYAPVEALETGFFTPHNIFIQVAAENGLVGLALLIGIIICVFKQIAFAGRSFYKNNEPLMETLTYAIRISFIGYLVGYMFLTQGAYVYNFWMLIGLSVALKNLAEKTQQEKELMLMPA